MDTSPEILLAIFRKLPKRPVPLTEVLALAGAPRSHERMILHLLRGMCREGLLVRLRGKYFALPEPARNAQGILHVSVRGTGFLIGGAGEGEDLYIHRTNLATAMDGDTVEVEIFAGSRGRDEGRVTNILKRAHETIVGEFTRRGKTGTVVPRNVKIGRWIHVTDPPPANRLHDGAWVLVRIRQWSASPDEPLVGSIEEILGEAGERGINILVLLRDLGVDLEFSTEVNRQVAHLSPPAMGESTAHRLDLRSEKIFTIDPTTAKDFDDAISVHRLENENWRLGVHIADVAEYVKADTPVDKEALKRATSIYPVDRVVPMLPERLSNELCSLRPREDRFAMSVFMEINQRGEILRYEIAESIICSRHRLTYEEVQAFFDRPGEHHDAHFSDIEDDLLAAREVARVLLEMRSQRGMLDLDLPETVVECNSRGETTGLRRSDRFESNRLVEECMLAANEVVAQHLRKMKLPALYRIHDIPNPTALEKLAPALGLFGVKVPKKILPVPEFYQPLIDRLHHVDGGHIAQRLILRTLMRAEYSPENRGHFGLASKCYCHFTSPIRRYPDLLVHRILKAWLHGETDNPEWRAATELAMPAMANQSNTMADRAVDVSTLR